MAKSNFIPLAALVASLILSSAATAKPPWEYYADKQAADNPTPDSEREQLREITAAFSTCYGTLEAAAEAFEVAGDSAMAEYTRGNVRGAMVSAEYLFSLQDGAKKTLGEYEDVVGSIAYGARLRMQIAIRDNETEKQTAAMQECVALNPLQMEIVKTVRENMYLEGAK